MTERKIDWFSRARDTIAYAIANIALNTIATRWYRDGVDRAIRRGLKAEQPGTYDITQDVSYLAEATYTRWWRKNSGEPKWSDLDEKTQQTYRMSAAWTINMLIGLRGYTPEGMR